MEKEEQWTMRNLRRRLFLIREETDHTVPAFFLKNGGGSRWFCLTLARQTIKPEKDNYRMA